MKPAREATESESPGDILEPLAEAGGPIPPIQRPRLRALLLKALQRRLTLVVAPSGFGKTIALRDAVTECGSQVIWLTITADDSSAERLAQRVTEEASSIEAAPAVRPGPHDAPAVECERVLASLLQGGDSSGLHVVLDGVDRSPSPDLVVAFALRLLSATPPGAKVAITGTVMPVAALDSLARIGQLAIVGPDRLALSRSEVNEALRRWACLEEDEIIDVACRVTAGWPRGIAAIAAAFPEKPAEGEMLRSSVIWACRPPGDSALRSLDLVDRELLLSISLLPAIEPADADTLTGVPGMGQRLRRLLESGTAPMARVGGRYVIENRTRDRLNAVLAAEIGAARMSERWAAAGRILEARGNLEDAISAYVKAGDGAQASRVLQAIGLSVVLDQDPGLLCPLADGLVRCAGVDDHGRALLGFMALVRGTHSLHPAIEPSGTDRGSIPEARPASPDAGEEPGLLWGWRKIARLLPEATPWTLVWDAWRLLDIGAGREAEPLIREAMETLAGDTHGFHWSLALICRARLHCHRGEYGAARAALARITAGEDSAFTSLMRERWLAEADALEGDLASATNRVESMMDLSARLRATGLRRELMGLAGMCAVWGGDLEGARSRAAEAEAEGMASFRIDHCRRLIARSTGSSVPATDGAGGEMAHGDGARLWDRLLLGFLLLREGYAEPAGELFDDVTARADAERAAHVWANAMVCRAYASERRGDGEGARADLLRFCEAMVLHGFKFLPASDSDLVLWAERAASTWWPDRRLAARRIIAAAAGRDQPVVADAPRARIEIHTLGALQLLVGGATQERGWNANRKAKRFFGLLLASPSHRISLDEAADTLWPDGDPDKIKHSLHNEVSNLRKILSAAGAGGHVEVRTEHGSYRLYCADDVEITDRAFERSAERGLAAVAGRQYDEAVPLLRAAATLYRGKFLEDARYESFAESRRAFLSELLVRCLHALAEIPSTCIQLNLPTKARYYLGLMKTRIVEDLDVPVPEWAAELEEKLNRM
ncbi:MAG: hypothetical protein MUE60_06250 [Candidatus Eisenbacteria bacterium]|nr:hypothetical protein [Candidatus Eisenbacteria bacterium]